MAEVVTRIGNGVYRVVHDDISEIVYVAGPPGDLWAFWSGQLFRGNSAAGNSSSAIGPKTGRSSEAGQSIEAPMPSTVIKVLVEPGTAVRKGDTLVLLEAMKMELPVRAPADGVVTAVHCRDGVRVEAGAVLVDLQ